MQYSVQMCICLTQKIFYKHALSISVPPLIWTTLTVKWPLDYLPNSRNYLKEGTVSYSFGVPDSENTNNFCQTLIYSLMGVFHRDGAAG